LYQLNSSHLLALLQEEMTVVKIQKVYRLLLSGIRLLKKRFRLVNIAYGGIVFSKISEGISLVVAS